RSAPKSRPIPGLQLPAQSHGEQPATSAQPVDLGDRPEGGVHYELPGHEQESSIELATIEHGTYEEVKSELTATARRIALEMRQRQTLQQLERLQLDDSGIIRLRHLVSSNVAELDSTLPRPAELRGSYPELDSALTPHPLTHAGNVRPDPESSIEVAAEASNNTRPKTGPSNQQFMLANADLASCRSSQSSCTLTEKGFDMLSGQDKISCSETDLIVCSREKELDMLSGQDKVTCSETDLISSSRDNESISYNANNISHRNRSNNAGMNSHWLASSQDTAHERPTSGQLYGSQTPSHIRYGSNNLGSQTQTTDQANYSPFSELDHLIEMAPARTSRR
ncbi:MAG: hypothetical protein Q9224_007235, partial [Gallowayella concinna]